MMENNKTICGEVSFNLDALLCTGECHVVCGTKTFCLPLHMFVLLKSELARETVVTCITAVFNILNPDGDVANPRQNLTWLTVTKMPTSTVH